MTHCRLKPRILCPFAPFFELARRVARPVTFTRLSRRERASGVAEAEKRVYKCVCDRVARCAFYIGWASAHHEVCSTSRSDFNYRRRVLAHASGSNGIHLNSLQTENAENMSFCETRRFSCHRSAPEACTWTKCQLL